MIKRIFLFLLINILIIGTISIVLFIVEKIFGINISGYGYNYTNLFIFSAIWGFVGSFISLFTSKWIAKKTYNIQIITPNNVFNLNSKEKIVWYTIEKLSIKHKIKMPEVGIYNDLEPNAFATGSSKNNSLVAVSTGLLDNMSNDEIEGVIGHEMSHILNGDMVTMTLLQGVLNTFVIFFARILANIVDGIFNNNSNQPGWGYYISSIIFELLFGILASIIAMWFSRMREFKADEGSARAVGKEKMINALLALKGMENTFIHTKDGQDNLASFKIEAKKGRGIASLFASHPRLDDRIKALENLRI